MVSRPAASLSHRTMSGLFWVTSGAGAKAALSLLVLAILGRLLSPADFGLVGAALVVINFSKLFSELGLGPALVQRRDIEPRHVQTAFTSYVLLGALLGGAIWMEAPLIARIMQMDRLITVLRALAWLFPVVALGRVSEFLLKRELQFRWLTNREVAAYALGYGGVGIGLAWLGAGVWALVAAQLAQSVCNVVLLLIKRPPSIRFAFEISAARELMSFGGGHTLAGFGNFAAQQGDNFVVGRWLGQTALGLYSRSYQLMATSASIFGGILDGVLFPVLSKVQDDARRLASTYLEGVAFVALVMVPASAVLIVLAPELIRVLLGPQWSQATVPFQIFAVAIPLRASALMSDSICRATGFVYRRAWRQWVYALLVVAGAWIGQFWGIDRVAIGGLVALAVNFLLMAQLSLQAAGLTWARFWEGQRPSLLLAAVAAAVAEGAAAILRSKGLPAIGILAAATGAAVVCLALLQRAAPGLFLGVEGVRIRQRLRDYVRQQWNWTGQGLPALRRRVRIP
jgi:O-antigen/teichoic acid export membrane protein